ncbi:MAG: hypothetical protein QXU06_05765 [Candidatus Bathyarchaeia archaeon]
MKTELEREGLKGMVEKAALRDAAERAKGGATLIIGTNLLHAHAKAEDWFKPTADKLLRRIARGEFGTVFASRRGPARVILCFDGGGDPAGNISPGSRR